MTVYKPHAVPRESPSLTGSIPVRGWSRRSLHAASPNDPPTLSPELAYLAGLILGLCLGIPFGIALYMALGPLDRWLDVRRRS